MVWPAILDYWLFYDLNNSFEHRNYIWSLATTPLADSQHV